MEKHVIKKDQANTVTVSESDSQWLINRGVVLSGSVGIANIDHDLVRFTIAGKIDSADRGLQSVGNLNGNDSADNTSVIVSATGRIFGNTCAVELEGSGVTVKNLGIISSSISAISFNGADLDIKNEGDIQSGQKAIDVHTTSFSIRNDGHITRTSDGPAVTIETTDTGAFLNGRSGIIDGSVGFEGSTGDIVFRNNGTVAPNEASNPTGVYLWDGNDRMVNRGRITGDIFLGAGDDTADFRRGKLIDSTVQGDEGDDTFVIDKANFAISEFSGEGNDTIKTTVSYTLGDAANGFIETLTAIGKENINLTGNSQANILNGNAANNKLVGGGGNDSLLGFGGNDVLTGGDGADHFFFYKKGGIDKITDFAIDEDTIHIIQIPGIEDFDDLEARMTMADGDGDGEKDDDTIIDLGDGSKIRLIGVDKDTLDVDDFSIFG